MQCGELTSRGSFSERVRRRRRGSARTRRAVAEVCAESDSRLDRRRLAARPDLASLPRLLGHVSSAPLLRCIRPSTSLRPTTTASPPASPSTRLEPVLRQGKNGGLALACPGHGSCEGYGRSNRQEGIVWRQQGMNGGRRTGDEAPAAAPRSTSLLSAPRADPPRLVALRLQHEVVLCQPCHRAAEDHRDR